MAENDRSFLEAALTAAPAMAGLGVGVRRMMGENFSTPDTISSLSAVKNMASPNIAANKINFGDHLDYMNNLTTHLGQQGIPESTAPEVARTAWLQAMRFADPISQKQYMNFTNQLSNMPSKSVYSAIKNTLRANQSALTHKIFGRFTTNVEALSHQYKITSNVPLFGGISAGAPTMRTIGSEQLPPSVRAYFERISKSLGGGRLTEYTRPGKFKDYRNIMMRFQGGTSLLVPLTNKGTFLEGKYLQTRYLAPTVSLYQDRGIQTTFSREEFLLYEFEKTILPRIQSGQASQFEIDQGIKAMR